MPFCLVKPLADKFKQALKDGTIDPQKLADMTSAERRSFFEELAGEQNAPKINAEFERRLLLKDQQQAMIRWAKQIAGLSKETRHDIVSRIERMDKVLDAKSEQAFLSDLAERRLGTKVTFEEAKRITELSQKVREARENYEKDPEAFGVAKVELQNYFSEIKRQSEGLTIDQLKRNPVQTGIEATSRLAGVAKSLKATLDNSALFRQGWKTMFTNPKTWAKNAAQSFADIAKQLARKSGDDSVMNAVKAEILSRKNSVDGAYEKMKLDIGTGEEAFPSSLPEKIPVIGRAFKASETAYNAFLMRMRADIADQYIETAKKNGVDFADKTQYESIGKLVNSLTGRGDLGRAESVGKAVNTIFFSPKKLKADLDFLTLHALDKNFSSFARKQAAKNLLKVVVGTAGIMATANAIRPGSAELDPTSADFGKIKVGDTRFDISGGMSSIVTLAARLLTGKTKNASGKVSELGNKFGQTSKGDVLMSFFSNKLSPAAALVRDVARGTDFDGKKITFGGELGNTFAPLPITNAIELLKNPGTSGGLALAAIIADALGVSTNTYASKKKNLK